MKTIIKNNYRGLIIWLLAVVFYFFDNLLNVSPAVMKPELSLAFNLSAADLGLLSSCYSWAYGLMQIPAGLLMDRLGPRRLFTQASLICGVGAFIFGSANSILFAKFGRILIGIGASFAVVGCSKVASIWFPAKRFSLFVGLMVSIGMLGAAFGLSTVNYVLQVLDWRSAMYIGSGIAIILSLLMWFIIKDHPSKHIMHQYGLTEDPIEPISVITGLKTLVGSPQVWAASIYAGLMFVPTLALGGLWGVPYLVEGHGLDRDVAGFLGSLIFIGWMFGGPIYGLISEKLQLRNAPMYFANIATLIVTLILVYTQDLSVFIIGSLMFLLGLCSSGFILAFAVTKESNDHRLSATAIGFINTLNTFLGAAAQWLIGKILDLTVASQATGLNNPTSFTYEHYRIALLSIPICLVISLLALTQMKETYCQEYKPLA